MPNTLTIDSKFRRETSNFKINIAVGEDDVSDLEPFVIKYIEKDLKPEELVGLVISLKNPPFFSASMVTDVSAEPAGLEEDSPITYRLALMVGPPFFYIPSTGALCFGAPIVDGEAIAAVSDHGAVIPVMNDDDIVVPSDHN